MIEWCLLRAAVSVLGVGLGSMLGDFLFRLLETGCAHLLFSTFQDRLALIGTIKPGMRLYLMLCYDIKIVLYPFKILF